MAGKEPVEKMENPHLLLGSYGLHAMLWKAFAQCREGDLTRSQCVHGAPQNPLPPPYTMQYKMKITPDLSRRRVLLPACHPSGEQELQRGSDGRHGGRRLSPAGGHHRSHCRGSGAIPVLTKHLLNPGQVSSPWRGMLRKGGQREGGGAGH